MDRGVPSLDPGLIAVRSAPSRRTSTDFRQGRQEVAVYHREGCLIFRQLADLELTKTVRLAAKITLEYKRNSYKIQSSKLNVCY